MCHFDDRLEVVLAATRFASLVTPECATGAG